MPRFEDLVVDRRGEARFRRRSFPCSVGRGGLRRDKREGDGATPIGVFRLEAVRFRPDRMRRPGGPLLVRPIRLWDGWSDDPRDPRYNDAVRHPHAFGHERLWRADRLYDLVVVMDANREPVRPGAGSALFLHVWRGPRKPTAGCIAFRRDDLEAILAGWTRRSRVVIRG